MPRFLCFGRRRTRFLRTAGFLTFVLILAVNFLDTGDTAPLIIRKVSSLPPVHFPPVAPEQLKTCFDLVTSPAGPAGGSNASPGRGDATAVVSLFDLVSLSQSTRSSLLVAATGALSGLIEGGVNHVVLVPGDLTAWDDADVAAVRSSVAAAVDTHGVGLVTAFSAVPPAAVQCLGISGLGAGVAWAVSSGAQSVILLDVVSAFPRASLRFGTSRPRFLAQASASGPNHNPQWRKHFQACGGNSLRQCDPLVDAPQLCSRWLRPVVQYGLCHPLEDHSFGRHSTVAANTPNDASLYSGHRLLEEVAPVTLPMGSVTSTSGLETDAAFLSGAGHALKYNRLADRSVGWVLTDSDAMGMCGQIAVETVLGVMRGNITILPPGRMCNTTAASASAAVPPDKPDLELLRAASAAARDALDVLVPDLLHVGGTRASVLFTAVTRAGETLREHGICSSEHLLALARWIRIYSWALHFNTVSSSIATVSNETGQQDPPIWIPTVPPTSSDTLKHCWPDHHNVRDILLVVNFNDWNAAWAPNNVHNLLQMHGASFPGIVVYTSKDNLPEISQGVPSLNLFYCPGGGGNSLGLKAQMCTGLALSSFEGHLGYLIINDDAMISPWNMLAYRSDLLWHKPPVGYEWYYDCSDDKAEIERRAASGKYPFGGWCYNCWSWFDGYGPKSLKKIHDQLPAWIIDIKQKNYGRDDGVSCSMVDVFYVPGHLAPVFGSLCILTATTGTEVELAQATIWDMVALRSEREHLRNIFRGHRAEEAYSYTLHDWAHKFPFSKNTTLAVAWAAVNASRAENLFYQPDIAQLKGRAFANDFY